MAMFVTFLATVAVNAMVFAFGYGKFDQRVATLEKQREEQRVEWAAARSRIEKIVEKLEVAIEKGK